MFTSSSISYNQIWNNILGENASGIYSFRDVPSSSIGRDTDNNEQGISWFASVHPECVPWNRPHSFHFPIHWSYYQSKCWQHFSKKKTSVVFSPLANYTDRAIAADGNKISSEIDTDVRIYSSWILKWALKNYILKMWNELIWLTIRSAAGFLKTSFVWRSSFIIEHI
jgi:hypothetical protein